MRIRGFGNFSKNENFYRVYRKCFRTNCFSVIKEERNVSNRLRNCTNRITPLGGLGCHLKTTELHRKFATEKIEEEECSDGFQTDKRKSTTKSDLTRKESDISSIEHIIDETNSMIYINEICFKMDQSLLKCQNFEQVLSILITHRGALFLQNLITAIRMLSGFAIEEKKHKEKEEKFFTTNGYNNCAKMRDLSTYHFQKKENNNTGSNNEMKETSLSKTEKEEEKEEEKVEEKVEEKNVSEMNPLDEIEKNVIRTYQNVFNVLNDVKLVNSENGLKKNRDISEIIVSDERYNLLINDIYKNRKHFDVVSICHILISLKVLNHKYFPLFNSFINPLKNFDVFIKEQFSGSQNLFSINTIIQLLLESFNAYIWAGYYSLDIYNKLINSVLLNNFIILNTNVIDTHIAQINTYPNVGYSYDLNYPLPIKQVFHYFNFNADLLKYIDKHHPLKKKSNVQLAMETDNGWRNGNLQIHNIHSQNENSQNEIETNLIGSKEISVICPIFLSFDLFLKSLQIYQHVYTYNPLFFEACEKVIYYYTPYLTPDHLSIICDTFSKHNIFTKEHDRVFYHIAKIVENNSEKFEPQHLYHILAAFKKVHLFFENCILLTCTKCKKYFQYLYITRQMAVLSLKEISILMNAVTYFNYSNQLINEFIKNTLNYLEDYIDEIDEETSINIAYALVLSNLVEMNTYLFSFIWRKIAKTTFWEKRKTQIGILWLSHMIQFQWVEFDLPKFCVLESLKIFYLKKRENYFSLKNIISKISTILKEFQVYHETFVDIYGPYILDILIPKKRTVFMLTQETTRNDIMRECGNSRIVSTHLKLFGYNTKFVNTNYFCSVDDQQQRMYIWQMCHSL